MFKIKKLEFTQGELSNYFLKVFIDGLNYSFSIDEKGLAAFIHIPKSSGPELLFMSKIENVEEGKILLQREYEKIVYNLISDHIEEEPISMSMYDPNERWGEHIVKVSFQVWGYKGYLIMKMGGNTKGGKILEQFTESEDFEGPIFENPMNFKLLGADEEDEEWCSYTLTSDDGKVMNSEHELSDIRNYIVGVEIINFVPKKADDC